MLYLSTPLMLVGPRDEDTLILYITMTLQMVSATLVVEREEQDPPPKGASHHPSTPPASTTWGLLEEVLEKHCLTRPFLGCPGPRSPTGKQRSLPGVHPLGTLTAPSRDGPGRYNTWCTSPAKYYGMLRSDTPRHRRCYTPS